MATPILGNCHHCYDEEAVRHVDRGEDYAYWTGRPRLMPVCEDCWRAVCDAQQREREAVRITRGLA